MDARSRERLRALAAALPRRLDEIVTESSGEADINGRPSVPELLDELEHRVEELLAERQRLLEDRRTSLRAWAWDSRQRMRWWTVPRLGVLWQHFPTAITVPSYYLRTRPPDPPPTISIVTPSYEQGEFIERTILSVLGQGYPELQYVVQDGASRDGTIEILSRYEDRLSCWKSVPDRGQAHAINSGFAHTTGEIMGFLNSDDVLLPGALAYVARYFAEHPEVDAVYGHRLLIDKHDHKVGTWVMPPHDDEMLRWSDSIPQETLFWRRALWDRVGGELDESFRFAADWDLLLRFVEAGARLRRVNRYLGAFRVHPTQKTTALLTLGERESDRLRERCHGRPIAWPEAYENLRPFLRRHLVLHTAHRAWERIVPRRVRVTFSGAETADRAPRVPDREPPTPVSG